MASEMVSAAKPKKARAPKQSKPKAPPSHPPYSEMICDAIVALKEKTGSSQYAISKFIEEKFKANLPPNFKKRLLLYLKKLVATGKLTKIKSSFKISAALPLPAKKPTAAAMKPKLKPKAAAAAAKPKADTAVKSKPAVAKRKRDAAPPPTKKQRPSKVSIKASPGKKAASVKPVKVKKPKSARSPLKKAVAARKAKKSA